ncbi:CdaR family transcriptional regulator [Jeotgalibaca sp. A127]|uniref:CdaR family transcriptional regulator n=1 Tax=Jeotgalibaca sp. A127 TaxID=3457324 RepID=UPI003FD66EAF
MKIEQSLAQNIVVSMKEIINQELNFIDMDSIIIASTDESRIGKSHGGAQEVMRSKEDLIIDYEGQYAGTKKGINVPVYSDLDMVGVIGITGDIKEVEKYGKIIKNMTEILIKDAWLKDVSFKKRENYRFLIEQLISETGEVQNILHLAGLLNVDLSLERIAAFGEITNFAALNDEKSEKLSLLLRRALVYDPQNLFNVNGSKIRLALNANVTIERYEFILQKIGNDAKSQLGLHLKFGIGTKCNTIKDFHSSFERAQIALDWALINSDAAIENYNDLDLGIILTTLDLDVETQFVNKILGKLSEEEKEEFSEILTIYGNNNGSNYKTADQLFIHKNTLQYKLIKLEKLTGYDPRQIDDYVILSLAFKLYNVMRKQIH